MKKNLFILAFFLILCQGIYPFSAEEFRVFFFKDYTEATEKASLLYPEILQKLNNNKTLALVGLAVVFPELVRFSYIKDVAETTTLEIAYIIGMDSDFSIGILQMKPSFIEQLETSVSEEIKKKYPALSIQEQDLQVKRRIRLQRLKQADTQLEYLAAFLLFMEECFPDALKNEKEAIRLFATAYNSGFNKSREELESLSYSAYFPYGKNWPHEQFVYADISIYFYLDFINKQKRK
jgi:hypothetical protein